jgi:polysaccharide export outer membrane protein
MLFRRLPALLMAVLLLLTGSLVSAQDLGQEYRLSAGDRIRIAVFGEPELSVTARIDGSGAISYPLLGELAVTGLTSEALERLIADRLRGPYLVDPRVTVSIEEYREFFIMGQVNRPGSYPYVPGLTVRRAISIAGGFTDIAARGKLFLISEQSPQQERRVQPDAPVGPGDTVVVKESLF